LAAYRKMKKIWNATHIPIKLKTNIFEAIVVDFNNVKIHRFASFNIV
jgi:hypothetical protein